MSVHKKMGKRGTNYQVRYRLADGKQVAKNFSTKKDALSFESQVRITKNQGLLMGTSFTKVFFKDFVKTWRETKVAQRPRTVARREGIIRNYLIPEFGSSPLINIRASDVQKAVNKWEKRGLSAFTIRNHVRVLGPIMDAAVRDDLISKNPVTGVVLPKLTQKRHILPNSVQLNSLLKAVGKFYEPLIYAGIATGMRLNELINLRIGDFDSTNKLLTVNDSKTNAGIRNVRLGDNDVFVFKNYLVETNRLSSETSAPLFISPKGHKINQSNFYRRVFIKAANEIGMPNLQFHDLRRLHATLLVDKGINPKVIEERLGHESISTTLKFYAQGTHEAHNSAVDIAATFIGQKAKS